MDPRITELHCIMPMANIGSVMKHGILSYARAAQLQHQSVAMPPVQELRDQKHVPGGLKLHQYANVYFHARNPMMYVRQNEAPNLCVLRVSTNVLKTKGTVITDCNASSKYVRFLDPAQWKLLNFDDILAADWTHADRTRYLQHKSRKCAEVLVPNLVPFDSVTGAYVVNQAARTRLLDLNFTEGATINANIFFR